jgi:hypothetical protein
LGIQDGGTRERLSQQVTDLRNQFATWSASAATQDKLRALQQARGLAQAGASSASDAEGEVSRLRSQARRPLVRDCCARLPCIPVMARHALRSTGMQYCHRASLTLLELLPFAIY